MFMTDLVHIFLRLKVMKKQTTKSQEGGTMKF